jgi:glutaredoxin
VKTIVFIYAKKCRDCKRTKKYLLNIIQDKPINLQEIDCETNEAIDLALNNGIEDIPACIIGEKVLFGPKIKFEDLENAIELLCQDKK